MIKSKCGTHSRLWLYFTGVVFGTIMLGFILTTAVWFILYRLDVIVFAPKERHIPLLLFAFGSLAIGVMIALLVGRLIIRPIQSIGNAFDELSKGNFSVRVSEDQKLEEIRDMAKHFNEMTFDLSHIETLRSDFVVNVSHEFKTPIAAIEGYATLLGNPSITQEKHDRYVEKILDNSRRLSNLSSDILTLSKLENQETIPNQKYYRLDEQLRRLVLSLENKWTARNIVFDIELPKVNFYGSEQMLDRVWLNILDNAIKHSPDGGTVTVEISQSEYTVSVSISDCGEGMSKDVQKHIFEKFYQADSSRKSEGNGLGLALAKRITDLCKGEISVESGIGNGSKFIVSLPIKQKSS